MLARLLSGAQLFALLLCSVLVSCARNDPESVSPARAEKIAIRYVHEQSPLVKISDMRAKKIIDNGSEWKVDIDIIPDGWDWPIEVRVRKSDGEVTYFHADQ